jgi:hypothetical protein
MMGGQQPHDAHKIPADPRHHPARHDKPIAFFFGATSLCPALVPSWPEGKKATDTRGFGIDDHLQAGHRNAGREIQARMDSIEPQCNDNTQDPTVGNVLFSLRRGRADYCTLVRASAAQTRKAAT